MATQLRAVVDNPANLDDAKFALGFARSQIAIAFPAASSIEFSFGNDARLTITLKVTKREDRDSILFALRNGMVPHLSFDNIIEGVETGARRRLTVTAEVR